MKASKLDIAYNLLTKKKKPTPFLKLWEEISQIEALSPSQQEDMIAQFYSDLCLDSRFVNMGENKWDLRSRHTFSETVIDTAEFMDDDGDEDDEFDLDDEEEENEKDEEKYQCFDMSRGIFSAFLMNKYIFLNFLNFLALTLHGN